MLLNLSNHPLAKWSANQRGAAEGFFGTIVDILFPALDPRASLTETEKIVHDYVQLCIAHLTQADDYAKENAIHIMGEFTFTYQFVKEMEKRNIPCVASTTERIVTDNPDGSKTTVFKFVQFRPYFELV
jgi:hypothetical protein